MNRAGPCEVKNKAAVLWFMTVFFAAVSFSQTAGSYRSKPPANGGAEDNNRFIVAFELSPEKGFTFTWPYESMRPAIYDTVLMKVKRMPRIINEYTRQSKPLLASRTLKVNGALQKPLHLKTNGMPEQFEIRLHQGRLRFALMLPERATLDPQDKVARIELYEINRAVNR